MQLALSEEQSILKDSVSRYFASHYSFDARCEIISAYPSVRHESWHAFAEELGILGALFSEEHGGTGGGAFEMSVIMTELGRALVVEPYLHAIVLAAKLLEDANHVSLLPDVVVGKAIPILAHGEPASRFRLDHVETTAAWADNGAFLLNGHKLAVVGAAWATHFILTGCTTDGIAAFLVPADRAGISRRDYQQVDGMLASDLILNDVVADKREMIGTPKTLLPLLTRAFDRTTVAACAEGVGIMEAMFGNSIDYVKQREQFGRPIGTFQALQHRLIDMLIEVEQAKSMVLMAARSFDERHGGYEAIVSATKAKVSQALRFVGQNAIQLHGGMGMTDELALAHHFRRGSVIELQFGSADFHLSRYEALGGMALSAA